MRRFLSALAAGLLFAASAFAATTPNSFVAPQTPNRGVLQFLQGTDVAGTYKTLYTGGANGSRCYGAWMTTNDATAHLVTLQVVNSTVKYGGATISTGTTTPGFASGSPAINILASGNWGGLPIDAYGNTYIQIISGDTLQATFATALTASDFINIIVNCVDF